MKRKNFIQLLLNAETDALDTSGDGLIDYKSANIDKKLTMNVRKKLKIKEELNDLKKFKI